VKIVALKERFGWESGGKILFILPMQRSFIPEHRVGSKGVAAEFEEGIFAKFGQRERSRIFFCYFQSRCGFDD
jgi:hypothetical protein